MSVTDFRPGKQLRLTIEENTFEGTSLADAELARDTYFSANPAKLALLDANSSLMIRLAYTTVDGSTTKFMVRMAGEWVDMSPVVQGLPGEVASLVGVAIGEIPYKLVDGTFGGSNMRVLEDGTILAPPGFGVESGSIGFGDVLTVSEISGFLGITNHLNGNQYTIVDFFTPRNAASSAPSIFHLTGAEQEFVAQGTDTTNLPDNPLTFDYTVQNTARTNKLKFRTYAPMNNVRIKITQQSNGVVAKYIPTKQAFEEGFGGVDWILGDNTFDFGDTPLIFNAGTDLIIEISADIVALKGNASGIPYFTATLQVGQFRDIITDAAYTAADVKAKLESLSSPNKLAKTAIQDAVLTVNDAFGDVTITAAGIGAQPLDATLTAIAGVPHGANEVFYTTGVDTFASTPLTAYARTLIDDASAASARATLGLGSIATQNAENVAITGGSISGITDLAIADGGTGASTASAARTNLGIIPGTYTPTGTNEDDVGSFSMNQAMYLAIGDTVMVSGSFDVDPQGSGNNISLGISLPPGFASNFTAVTQLAGTACCMTIGGQSAGIEANVSADRASVRFISTSTSNASWTYQFMYRIL